MSSIIDGLISIFYFVYLILWLCYLFQKHNGSGKAAHIFELNILLDSSLFMAFMIIESFVIAMDSEILCSLTMFFQHVTLLSYYLAIAASHIETMYFLKVNKDLDFMQVKGYYFLSFRPSLLTQ